MSFRKLDEIVGFKADNILERRKGRLQARNQFLRFVEFAISKPGPGLGTM